MVNTQIERVLRHDGIVAVLDWSSDLVLRGRSHGPHWLGDPRWHPIVHEAVKLRQLSGESSVRVLVGDHAILISGDEKHVVGVVFIKGHPVVKSVVRMVRQLLRPSGSSTPAKAAASKKATSKTATSKTATSKTATSQTSARKTSASKAAESKTSESETSESKRAADTGPSAAKDKEPSKDKKEASAKRPLTPPIPPPPPLGPMGMGGAPMPLPPLPIPPGAPLPPMGMPPGPGMRSMSMPPGPSSPRGMAPVRKSELGPSSGPSQEGFGADGMKAANQGPSGPRLGARRRMVPPSKASEDSEKER